MSLNFPDRNGLHSASDDSRITVDMSNQYVLATQTNGILMIGCGNPLLNQDFFNEWDGANNAVFELFGNSTSVTSPGYMAIRFDGYGRASNANTFKFEFRPNGGTQAAFSCRSAAVTETNCDYIVVERKGDDYAVHLFAKDGTKTAGSFVTHTTGSLGPTWRSTAKTYYFGGINGLPAGQTAGHWRGSIENFILVEDATAFTSLDTKIQNIIAGGSPVTEFGATQVEMWRTFKDKSASSLTAESTATTDDVATFVLGSGDRTEVGSPIAAVNATTSCHLDEKKLNFVGLEGTDTTTTLSLTGTYIGSVTNVEGRLLNKSDLSEVQTWKTLEATPASGTWSGSFSSVPAGEYVVELRPSNATSNVFQGRNPWAVGYVMIIHGQSQDKILHESRGGTGLDSVPSTAKAYLISNNANSTYGYQTACMRMYDSNDYPDGYRYAQIEWERDHAGVPVMWVDMAVNGSDVDDWQTNIDVITGYKFYGDGSAWKSGYVTDILKTIQHFNGSKVNILLSWGTADITDVDYENKINGWFWDEGTGYTGASFKHLKDIFSTTFGMGLVPLTRHTGVALDNYTADPVSDDYPNGSDFRDRQKVIVEGWLATKANDIVVGPFINDMGIEAAGGPHQDNTSNANWRFGAKVGMCAAWLIQTSPPTNPSLPATGYFTTSTKDEMWLQVSLPNSGALKNNDGTTDVAGFEISENNGVNWNRKGFTATYDAATGVVTLAKNTGDWSGATLKWRYQFGGPYSYGTDYKAQADADIEKGLYESSSYDANRGIPVIAAPDGYLINSVQAKPVLSLGSSLYGKNGTLTGAAIYGEGATDNGASVYS